MGTFLNSGTRNNKCLIAIEVIEDNEMPRERCETYKILLGKPERRLPLRRPQCSCEDNV